MPLVVVVRIIATPWLENDGGQVLREVHVASQNAYSGLRSATVTHTFKNPECFPRYLLLVWHPRIVLACGCPDVQLSMHQTSHHVLVSMGCDLKLPDDELRVNAVRSKCILGWFSL